MEISNLNRLKSLLKRYKLKHRTFGEDDIEIGGGNNIKYLQLYYLYIPFAIASTIILIGFLIDFIFLMFCSAPFLLYVLYGFFQISNAIKDNQNTTIIKNGEIRISINNMVKILNSENIKNYEIKSECKDDKIYKGQLMITDSKNNQYIILILVDDEQTILNENLEYLINFIQTKMKVKVIH